MEATDDISDGNDRVYTAPRSFAGSSLAPEDLHFLTEQGLPRKVGPLQFALAKDLPSLRQYWNRSFSVNSVRYDDLYVLGTNAAETSLFCLDRKTRAIVLLPISPPGGAEFVNTDIQKFTDCLSAWLHEYLEKNDRRRRARLKAVLQRIDPGCLGAEAAFWPELLEDIKNGVG